MSRDKYGNSDWFIVLFAIAGFSYLKKELLKNTVMFLPIAMLLLLLIVLSLYTLKRKPKIMPEAWSSMSGAAFEDQVVIWLKQCGYKHISKTEYFDQGIDIIAARPGVILGVQVKRSKRPVGVAAVRAAIAGLKSYGCTQAMVVTDADFTLAARRLGEVNDCRLVSGGEIKSSLFRQGLFAKIEP